MVTLFSHVNEDQPEDPDKFRIVKFDEKRSIGKIDFRSADTMMFITSDSSGCLARGEVRFPQGMRATLTVSNSACADLSCLENLSPGDLESIHFDDCCIEDFQLKHIQHLTGLEHITFKNTNISEFGLFFLKELIGLHTLILDRTPTNDLGLSYLANLNLLNLYMTQTLISDEGLVALKTMPILNNVSLPETITDDGLARLAGLILTQIDLGDCIKLSNTGLQLLCQLPKLRGIYLPPQFDDDAVILIKPLSLDTIYFTRETRTTATGRERLQSEGICKRAMIVTRC